jgi:V/A-type H+-transporting ATPase subunit E
MTDKIQEITEKIYNEGVVKAKSDAELLLNDAKKEAADILKKAKSSAEEIIQQAKKDAAEMKNNAETEMKLAARQFVSNLKQKISMLIQTRQIKEPLQKAFNDVDFIKSLVLKTIENWNPGKADLNLKILIPEEKKNEFTDMLTARTLEAMNKGLEIQIDSKTKNGFKIGPKDGSFIISFSDEDFENYFKNYFKEKTRKLLFENESETA